MKYQLKALALLGVLVWAKFAKNEIQMNYKAYSLLPVKSIQPSGFISMSYSIYGSTYICVFKTLRFHYHFDWLRVNGSMIRRDKIMFSYENAAM